MSLVLKLAKQWNGPWKVSFNGYFWLIQTGWMAQCGTINVQWKLELFQTRKWYYWFYFHNTLLFHLTYYLDIFGNLRFHLWCLLMILSSRNCSILWCINTLVLPSTKFLSHSLSYLLQSIRTLSHKFIDNR